MMLQYLTSPKTSTTEGCTVAPIMYPSLVDILLRFRQFKIALTSDVSSRYWAVHLPMTRRVFTAFCGEKDSEDSIQEY